MRMRTCIALIVLLTLTASASFAQTIYWTDSTADKIRRGNIDGTGTPEDLFDSTDGLFNPISVALDIAAGKVYWTDADGITAKIKRGNMDGTGSPEDLFDETDGLGFPFGIALDIAAGKVYWTDISTEKIQRGNMDGTGTPEDLFDATDGLSGAIAIALDIAAGKVYWARIGGGWTNQAREHGRYRLAGRLV